MAHGDWHQRSVALGGPPIRIAAAVLLALACASCIFDDYGPIGPLRQMPEATLYYPGAKVVDEVSQPRISGPDGPQGASYGHNLAVNATPDEVVAFYDRELKTRGWTRTTSIGLGRDVADAVWRKPGHSFVLGIASLADISRLPSDLQQAYSGYQFSVSVSLQEDWPPESPSPTG
jgi:hypothetical protein